jgi:hypothetical protein
MIGAVKIDIVGSTWYPIVDRGNYYYLSKPIYVGPQEGAYPLRIESSLGGTLRWTGKFDSGFTPWIYDWLNGHAPTDANNEADAGELFYALPYQLGNYSLKPSGHGGHYQNRKGQYRRAYFPNDEALEVLAASATAQTITTEAIGATADITLNTLHRDSGQIILKASGAFDSSGSAKALKIRFVGTGTDDFTTGSLADAGYAGLAWELTCTITRRSSTSVVYSTVLFIDGQLPIVKQATETGMTLITTSATLPLASSPLSLYVTQSTVNTYRIWWQKSADTD